MKTGLVLEGGAMRGIYTAAILDSLLEEDIKIDAIIGVSAGAIFGVNYPSKQKGRVLRYNKKYCKDKNYMGFWSLIKTGNIINKQMAYYDVPLKYDLFDEEAFAKSGIDFYATMTNLNTGKAEYKKIVNASIQIEELRASSSMPFLSKPVKIDNEVYLDGAIADSIPVMKMREMGFDKIIVVETRDKFYRKKKTPQLPPKIIYHKYPNFVSAVNDRYERYNKCLEDIIDLENRGEIYVFRPSKPLNIKKLERDPKVIDEAYELGLNDFKEGIKGLKEYLKKK